MIKETAASPTKLWDWPVRLVHWSFVVLMPLLYWTWKSDRIPLHETLGYITLALIVFRFFWGFAGSSTARFRGFVRGPGAVFGYIRTLFGKEGEPIVGHNPLGGWSVVILLGLLLIQVGLGTITQDVDGIESGPLARYVSYDTADLARHYHGLVFDLLLVFIGVHLCAILFYTLVKRDNLVGPMITGRKRLHPEATAPSFAPIWRLLVGIVLAAAIAWWVSKGAPV